jgi:hypothetical protein
MLFANSNSLRLPERCKGREIVLKQPATRTAAHSRRSGGRPVRAAAVPSVMVPPTQTSLAKLQLRVHRGQCGCHPLTRSDSGRRNTVGAHGRATGLIVVPRTNG